MFLLKNEACKWNIITSAVHKKSYLIIRFHFNQLFWYLLVDTEEKMQWAAVTTHLELTRVPPQKKSWFAWDFSLSKAIQGYSLISESTPPTTRWPTIFTPHSKIVSLLCKNNNMIWLKIWLYLLDVLVVDFHSTSIWAQGRYLLGHFAATEKKIWLLFGISNCDYNNMHSALCTSKINISLPHKNPRNIFVKIDNL